MPRYLRRILKIFLWFLGVFILLLVGMYFFIQTETFNKSWELKDSKLNVESVNGNILKGIRASNGTIIVKEDTLLKFTYLDTKYDIWGLLDHEIRVENLTINSPKINLVQLKYNKDSLIWNFMNLFSSAEEKDTSISEFDWDLTLEKLKIENGRLKVAAYSNDTSSEWRFKTVKQDTFNFNFLDLTNFEMELNARYFRNYKNISI